MTGPSELRVRANGLDFFALADGPERGALVLLLHGFPELSRSWRHQLPALGGAGFRAVAPDLRGYGRTGGGGPYDLQTLAADVAALVRALGRERAVVCGHDWGGGAAWAAATFTPEVVERLVVLNCPHPVVLGEELVRNPRQLARSSHMLFFQIPVLPERRLSRHAGAAIARALRGGAHVKRAFPDEELARYRAAFATPASLSGPLGYYRAALRGTAALRRAGRARRITAPTLLIWGVHDRFLGVETIDPARLAPWFAPGNAPEIRLVPGAGHFVQNEAPEVVNAALLGWLAARPVADVRP